MAEQLVYEIGDPSAYLLPDVECDWTGVTLTQAGTDRVRVSGAKGCAPGSMYKVGACALDGYTAEATMLVSGYDAKAKARAVAKGILEKTGRLFAMGGLQPYTDTRVDVIGTEGNLGQHASQAVGASREVLMRIAVKHAQKKALHVFATQIAPCATGMAPGLHALSSARPKPHPSIAYFSAMIEKSDVPVTLHTTWDDARVVKKYLAAPTSYSYSAGMSDEPTDAPNTALTHPDASWVTVPLICVCFGRSGDKGDNCNVGLISRHPSFLPYILQQVTTDFVRDTFSHFLTEDSEIVRYTLPG